MFNVAIVTDGTDTSAELRLRLSQEGFAFSVLAWDAAYKQVPAQAYNLVVLDMENSADMSKLAKSLRQQSKQPIIAVITKEMLDSGFDIDDFVVKPYDIRELILRIKKLIHAKTDSSQLISCSELVIDTAEYQVAVGGRLIELTFKEYELLKFLASNQGRVFTRDALLNKVWGYEYFGGDRTVDVHIRRLRSKIEDADHTFIDTVRNIGYRFRKMD